MAAGKEIRGKIKSIEDTKKITKAMEMVSVSKMRKAQERMRAGPAVRRKDPQPGGEPVAGDARVQDIPSWSKHDAAKTRRLHRRHHRQGAVRRPQHQRAARVHRQAEASWRRGRRGRVGGDRQQGPGLPNRIGAKVVSQATQLGDRPQLDKLVGPVKVLLDAMPTGAHASTSATPLHQHDAPGAGDRAAAAADRRADDRRKTASTAGTTSTSPRRRS